MYFVLGWSSGSYDVVAAEEKLCVCDEDEDEEGRRSREAGRSTINAPHRFGSQANCTESATGRDDRSALEAHSSCSRGAEPVPGL